MEDVGTQTQATKGHKKTGSQNLQGQAATAALFATNADKRSKAAKSPLDADGKLSSAGAATSLKYAQPQDLPWFPTVGITDPDSSAGAAASLANTNQKSFEYWKPEYSEPANKSAHLAWDYKAAPLWHPEMSAAGSKAATLAAKQGGDVNIWRPEATAEGNSAAGQAMRMKNLSPAVDYGYTEDGHRRALMAAAGAMSGRNRSGSSPVVTGTYPDRANSAANALNAATVANRPSTKNKSRGGSTDIPGLSEADATRIHDAAITNLGREMYTSHPPVAPEVEEKNRQAGIRAAAISMAKQMYAVQQKAIENAAAVPKSDGHYAANSAHGRKLSFSSSTDESVREHPQYANLEEAARKLAAERLAKIGDPNAANIAYRDYYGANAPVQSRLSIRGRMRRRASSDGQLTDSDELRSQTIRSQMSIFNNNLAQIDAKKRQTDRDALMAAAQRNVAQRMHGIDEKVFAETGKVSPAMMAEWETKARAKAEADSSARMVNHGKVSIGGGKFMDQSEVDAIAKARVQPTLDEITENAEARRARDEQIRLAAEERKILAEEQTRNEREREARTKDEWRRFKGMILKSSLLTCTNIFPEEEKLEERTRKEQEKARKLEEKRLKDEEKRKSRAGPVGAALVSAEKTKATQAEASAPVLDPIPTVAPFNTEEISAPAPTDSTPTTEEAIVPETKGEAVSTTTKEPMPEAGRELSSEVVEEPVSTATEEIEPTATATEGIASVPTTTEETEATAREEIIPKNVDNDRAAAIAARVFAAPLVNSSEDIVIPSVSTDDSATAPLESTERSVTEPVTSSASDPAQKEPAVVPFLPTVTATASGPQTVPASPKPDGGPKLSSWLKSKFSRNGKAAKTSDEPAQAISQPPTSKATLTKSNPTLGPEAPSYLGGSVGGATLAPQESTTSTSHPTRSRSTSISSLSSDMPTAEVDHSGTEVQEPIRGRTRSNELRKESTAESNEGSTPEEFEEARDQFDSDKLPLPSFPAGQARPAESPVRDSRFVENL
ncbi:hypothetical protein MMC11_008877 [Xylographa trunciseda]|nr:hypothetical protein [Xylographa trunciseda]